MIPDNLASLYNSIIGRKAFYTFQWHITDRCNLSCTHCYQEYTAEDPDKEKLQHVLEQIRSFLLFQKNIRTLISFTAHKKNFIHFQDVVKTGCRLGVQTVWADRLVPLGHGEQLETLDKFETRSFFEQMLEARQWVKQRNSKTKIVFNRALPFLVGGGTPYSCKAGDSLITIMPDGTLLPCRRIPVVVGNLYRSPLVDIYHSSPFLKNCETGT